MIPRNNVSFSGRLVVGLLLIALGLLPLLAALDVGPLHQGPINGTPWLGAAAGGVFLLSGVAVLAGEGGRDHFLSAVMILALIVALVAIANWIAFGAGMRQCSAGYAGFFSISSRPAGQFECRLVFGIGAGGMNGLLLWILAQNLRKAMGPGHLPDLLERMGLAILLLPLAPILLPLFLVLIGINGFRAVREHWRTGQWPRNAALLARMRKRARGD